MIYKCNICGELNQHSKEDFETESAVLYIEHLEGHIDIFFKMLDEKDEEITALKQGLRQNSKGKHKVKKYHKKEVEKKAIASPVSPASPIATKYPRISRYPDNIGNQTTESEPAQHNKRIPFTDEIKKILLEHYSNETAQQLQQRILKQTGRTVHISSIYNWMSKNKNAQ